MTSVYLRVTNPTRRFHHHDVITSTNARSPHPITLGFGFRLNDFEDTGTFGQLFSEAWENSVASSYFAHESKVNFVPKSGIICKVASVPRQTDGRHHWFGVDKRETPYGSCTQSLDHVRVCVMLCLLMTEKERQQLSIWWGPLCWIRHHYSEQAMQTPIRKSSAL